MRRDRGSPAEQKKDTAAFTVECWDALRLYLTLFDGLLDPFLSRSINKRPCISDWFTCNLVFVTSGTSGH